MRIVIIGELSGGGVEVVNVRLAKELAKDNSVYFISLVSKNREKENNIDNVSYIFLHKNTNKEAFFSLINAFKRIIPDVIVTCCLVETYFAVLYSRIINKKCKVIYVQHSVYSTTLNDTLKQWVKYDIMPKVTHIFNFINAVVFVSEGVHRDFNLCNPKYKAVQRVIYNPMTEGNEKFEFKEIKKNKIRLVTAGRLEEEKQQWVCLEALKILRSRSINATLTIYGQGSLKKELENKAKELCVSEYVEFPGFVTDFPEKVKEYDIFILSSKYESFGNVLVEAMVKGVPVISTDCPVGPREILGNGRYGRLIPVNDPKALSCAIIDVAENNTRENVLEAFNRCRDFSINASVLQYKLLFHDLLTDTCE